MVQVVRQHYETVISKYEVISQKIYFIMLDASSSNIKILVKPLTYYFIILCHSDFVTFRFAIS